MTPAEIETAARRKYNSSSSSFYSSNEIYDLIYQAELEIARETLMIEGATTISGGSISGTRTYALPSTLLEVKRVEYDGQKLEPIDFRQDDAATLMNSNTTATGRPQYYTLWNDTLYLRPIPDTSALVIKLYGYNLPAQITSASQVLEVPKVFHMAIVDYVVAEMATKDQNSATAQLYFDKWYNKHLPAMKSWAQRRRRGDQFAVVKDMDTLADTILGNV